MTDTPHPTTAQAKTEPKAVHQIERALEALLAAITKHRPRRDAEASPFDPLLADPVGDSLRRGIQRLGKRLYALGGAPLLHLVLHQVADGSPERFAILNHEWNGVGIARRNPQPVKFQTATPWPVSVVRSRMR